MSKTANELMEIMETEPLWKLPFHLSRLEYKVHQLKELGESRKSTKLNRTIEKRNRMRRFLHKKLGVWIKEIKVETK